MVLDTDYTSYSIVYNCDAFFGGAYKDEYLWILSRTPLAINSAAWTTFKASMYSIVESRIPKYTTAVLNELLRPTEHTTAKGCVYKPL